MGDCLYDISFCETTYVNYVLERMAKKRMAKKQRRGLLQVRWWGREAKFFFILSLYTEKERETRAFFSFRAIGIAIPHVSETTRGREEADIRQRARWERDTREETQVEAREKKEERSTVNPSFPSVPEPQAS